MQTGAVGETWTQITDGLDVGQTVVLADLDAPLPTSATDTQSTGGFGGPGGFGGGGGGGGLPMTFSSNHLPRVTGEVRVGYDVTVRILPCPSSPPRVSSLNVTRRKWLPYTFGIP